ncbi:MAG: hypothetical protein WC141_04285 [Arcobacteraceae bacterium]
MNSIDIKQIGSWLIDVSEPIAPKHFHEFAFFQLEEKGIVKNAQSVLFYSYIKECQKYFLAHFYACSETSFIEPQILKAYFLKQIYLNKQTIVFILNDYFAIYENEELLFFKPTKQKVTTEQIGNFVEKSLQLKIDLCIEIDEKEKLELKEEFIKNCLTLKKPIFLKNNHYKELKRFAYFSLLATFFVTIIVVYETMYENKKNYKQKVTYYSPKKELISAKIVLFLQNINSFNLEMQTMTISNESVHFFLRHPKKTQLIEFLTLYKGEVKTLNYNEQEKMYELNALFKLS